ncbi:RhuM family protein [Brucella pituitosa]|uniref:RhuM family protein n=1 Tax=Brucella pituitosa TaxID=571256 RepID=UPI003F4ACFF1
MSDETTNKLSAIQYEHNAGETVELGFDSDSQSIWATQEDIAQLFGRDVSTISRHITNVFEEGELDEPTSLQKVQTTTGRPAVIYNLDVIISVGYRVSSSRATAFRKWATQIIRAYLEQGYVINEKALRDSPEKLNKLAAEIRALRASEKQVYAKVRECFKVSSSDYDPSASEVRKFYALLQDKFHHAVTGLTSSKLILDRADHYEENLGLLNMDGDEPTLKDAQIGKNYLRQDELYRLHLLSEQFLLFAESTALTQKKMTMQSLHDQLDRLLTLNNYPVFDGYKDFIKKEAMDHAKVEFELFQKRRQIEAKGLEYDEEALSLGEYDEFLELAKLVVL